jgi:hypothetical protein
MATIIQIKRSANVTAPTTADLVEGELAYSEDKSNSGAGAKLYIESLDSGDNAVIHAIGGKYYTDKIDAATASNTPSTLVYRNSLGNFAANVITADNFVGNITVASAPKLTTARDIGLAGDLTGNVSFDGSQNVTLTATIAANSVALGTDTTGNYLANVIPGTGLTGSGFGTEGATPTLTLAASGVTPTTYGGTTNIPVLVVDTYGRVTSASNAAISTSFTLAADTGTNDTFNSGDVLRISGGTGIDTSITDNTFSIAIETTGVAASTYGGAASVGRFTVDATGRLTSAGNVSIAIPSSALTTDVALGSQTSGAYVANLVAGTGITITGLGNEGTTPTITNAGVTSITGTTNEIEVDQSTGAVQVGLPNDVVIGNNLTVTGDLIVQGTAVTLNTATITLEDPLIKLGNANPSDSLDIGFFGEYTSSGTKWAGLFRDASDSGKFKLFNALTVNPTSNVVDTASYTVATLVANLTGGTVSGLTANIAVSDGGTGRGTLTTNSILYGQGTSAVGMATGTSGQVLQINGSGVPIFAGIDGGTY